MIVAGRDLAGRRLDQGMATAAPACDGEPLLDDGAGGPLHVVAGCAML